MGSSILIPPNTFEPYVDSLRAAEFLAMSRKTLLELARKGRVPAHPVGQGVRKTWKFRISELDSWMRREVTSTQRLRTCSRRTS